MTETTVNTTPEMSDEQTIQVLIDDSVDVPTSDLEGPSEGLESIIAQANSGGQNETDGILAELPNEQVFLDELAVQAEHFALYGGDSQTEPIQEEPIDNIQIKFMSSDEEQQVTTHEPLESIFQESYHFTPSYRPAWKPPVLTPAVAYVLMCEEGFVGAFTDRQSMMDVHDRFLHTQLVVFEFRLSHAEPTDVIYILPYLRGHMIALATNSKMMLESVQKTLSSVGFVGGGSDDYFIFAPNEVCPMALARLEAWELCRDRPVSSDESACIRFALKAIEDEEAERNKRMQGADFGQLKEPLPESMKLAEMIVQPGAIISDIRQTLAEEEQAKQELTEMDQMPAEEYQSRIEAAIGLAGEDNPSESYSDDMYDPVEHVSDDDEELTDETFDQNLDEFLHGAAAPRGSRLTQVGHPFAGGDQTDETYRCDIERALRESELEYAVEQGK
jgi:hypothetical protein